MSTLKKNPMANNLTNHIHSIKRKTKEYETLFFFSELMFFWLFLFNKKIKKLKNSIIGPISNIQEHKLLKLE
jgi:hypothetical protein